MTDGVALYRAILARPEDDTPRLVYADWLDENGHERQAEFIRMECRLESSSPDHPDYTEWSDRREELRLWLQAHDPRPPLKTKLSGIVRGALEGHNWWSPTSRGFPRFLLSDPIHGRLGVKGIRKLATSLEKAFAIIPTRHLVVGFPVVEDVAEFLKQPVVSGLNGITISTNEQAGDDAARIIAESKLLCNLRSAALNFSIGEGGADALSRSEHFGQMDWFWLSTYQLSPQAIRLLGNGRWFRDLRELTLEDGLSAEAFEELCLLPSFPRLHTLNISHNSFPVSSWQAFARSKTFPQLTKLILSGGVMSNGQMAALAASDLCLADLDLGGCAIGNEGVRALVTVRWVETLRNLDLSRNLLGVSAATTIASCGRFRALKRLDLAGNPIRGGGLKAIAESSALQNLSTLQLSDCRERNNAAMLSSDFQEFLQKLHMPNARYLDLSNMPIGSKAAQMLAGDKFRNLTRLRLAKCKLTDNAVSALLSSPYLQGLIDLDLSENQVTTGAQLLTDRRILPLLSRCYLTENPLTPDLCRKLGRRPGVIVRN